MELDNILNHIYNCFEVTQDSFGKEGVNQILEAFVFEGGVMWASEFLLGVSIGNRVSKSSTLTYN